MNENPYPPQALAASSDAYNAALDSAYAAAYTAAISAIDKSYGLEDGIAVAKNKAEILLALKGHNCLAINQVIKTLKVQASELKKLAYEITDKVNILSDEVRRRAEQLECRIYATTDDDLK